jgi:hypothetical protein
MELGRLVTLTASLALLAACSSNNNSSGSATPVPSAVQGTQGSSYAISVFAQSPSQLRPDDMVQVGNSIFVVYQDNNINPDGTLATGVTSAQAKVIEYDTSGNVQQTVPGHPDGIVEFNSTTLWVSSNEDANAEITVIDISSSTAATTTLTSDTNPLPHGGGLDDMKVINGTVYASGSNPTLTTNPSPNLAPYSTDSSGATAEYGVNTGPGVYAVSLNQDGTTFHATPVVMSSSSATLLPGNTAVTLNMTDADSSAIDPNGDLVTDSQQDSELVITSNIGTASQATGVLPLTLYGNPWPVDDTRWSPASGNSFMLVTDNQGLLIYRIDASSGAFAASTAYSAGQGTVLQTDIGTGVMTPIYVGMNTPHGIIFVQ